MCNTFDKDHKDAKEMKRCLQTVLNLYEQVTVEYVRSDET